MKKIIRIVIVLTCAAIALFLIKYYKTGKTVFTIEWHEITLQTYPTMQPLFKQLQPIVTEAFVPMIKPCVYATDPRVANVPDEKKHLVEQKVIDIISEISISDFNGKIDQIYGGLQNNQIPVAYLAIAKDNQQKIIGFVLIRETHVKDHVKDDIAARVLNITEGSLDSVAVDYSVRDEVFIDFLSVRPGTQKKGVGKTLLFEVFNRCPHIKKIYLTTSASDFNKNTQGFYEHIGFTRALKVESTSDEEKDVFNRNRILYMYKRAVKKNE
jgi:ribosomal protein S18 acetylase RimI-like enzyme